MLNFKKPDLKNKSRDRARSVPEGLTSPGTDDIRTREGRKLKAALMTRDSTTETCLFSVMLSCKEDFKKYSRALAGNAFRQIKDAAPLLHVSHQQKVSEEGGRTRAGIR